MKFHKQQDESASRIRDLLAPYRATSVSRQRYVADGAIDMGSADMTSLQKQVAHIINLAVLEIVELTVENRANDVVVHHDHRDSSRVRQRRIINRRAGDERRAVTAPD